MSNLGEDFRTLREINRAKRCSNTESSTQLLREQGIPFESRNGGRHLIVDGVADFWPSTGLFIPRDRSYSKDRGVFRLIKFVLARQYDRRRAKAGS